MAEKPCCSIWVYLLLEFTGPAAQKAASRWPVALGGDGGRGGRARAWVALLA